MEPIARVAAEGFLANFTSFVVHVKVVVMVVNVLFRRINFRAELAVEAAVDDVAVACH